MENCYSRIFYLVFARACRNPNSRVELHCTLLYYCGGVKRFSLRWISISCWSRSAALGDTRSFCMYGYVYRRSFWHSTWWRPSSQGPCHPTVVGVRVPRTGHPTAAMFQTWTWASPSCLGMRTRAQYFQVKTKVLIQVARQDGCTATRCLRAQLPQR